MPHKDPIAYRAYMRRYMKEKWRKRRKEAIDFLGGKCVKCGSNIRLEFDHIDPSTKKFTIAKLSSCSDERFWQEIAKCQLLFRTCHELKTLKELYNADSPREHGRAGTYRRGCRCDLCRQANKECQRHYRLNGGNARRNTKRREQRRLQQEKENT